MAKPPIALDAIRDAMPDFDAEENATLRQQAMRDPIPGCPMDVQILPGGETETIEAGEWRNVGALNRTTGLPINCPVTPLGCDGMTSYFLDTLGCVMALEAGSSGKGPIGALFKGRSLFLEWAWPRFGRPSKMYPRGQVNGWDADDARQALVDACAYKGTFALEDQVRGRGAWRDVDDGLIYHAGDHVWIDGKWRPCGAHGDHIYPARPKIGRPSRGVKRAGEGSAGRELLDLLRTFNWDRGELDAHLMLGWTMTAKIGGALNRRPVAFVTGEEGSGKSTLQAMLRVVMNGALIATSNTTQAGIYQRLQQDSIAILVDEMEAKDDTRTVDKILELARITYSGDKMQRGGKDGVGKEFSLNSSFLGSSISKPATDAQDDSRMVVMMLRAREAAGGKLDVDHATLDGYGRDLLKRIFDGWETWDAIVGAFRDALISIGHTDRACDTFAPLAAGAHLATCDAMPDTAVLTQWCKWLDPRELAETSTKEKTWRRCLTHMLEAQPDVWRTAAKKSVGALLEGFQTNPEHEETVNSHLPQVGLSMSFRNDDQVRDFSTMRLFVPAKHPALHALFAGTPWAGRQAAPGPWAGVLRQMPKELYENGKCGRGLDSKASGLFINLAAALEA